MSSEASSYTHGYHRSVLRAHDNRTVENSAHYLLEELRPGKSLLDVGSGVGTITADLARRLSPGRVTAFEVSIEALALTRGEVERQGLENVDFVLGDAHALEFAPASFDIVHAHQVLQHLADPVLALREMKRVCRPGGTVAARDADYAGFVWFPQLPELDEWLAWYQQLARSNGGEPNAGRHLLSWAHQAGFTEVVSTSSTWCLSTPQSRTWWGAMWAERILDSRIACQLLDRGIASRGDLERVSRAWLRWAAADDGWMSMVHGEILCCDRSRV